MCVSRVRMFFLRQFHWMCSIVLLYLLIVLNNCKKKKKKTPNSNFIIRLLLLESTNTIPFPLGKTRVFLKVIKFLMFLLVVFIVNLVV